MRDYHPIPLSGLQIDSLDDLADAVNLSELPHVVQIPETGLASYVNEPLSVQDDAE